jgi:hypothetical protein
MAAFSLAIYEHAQRIYKLMKYKEFLVLRFVAWFIPESDFPMGQNTYY